jgi:hypothetical protein
MNEDHRLSMFNDRMLRKILVPWGEYVRGYWMRLSNEKCHVLYSPLNAIRVIK